MTSSHYAEKLGGRWAAKEFTKRIKCCEWSNLEKFP